MRARRSAKVGWALTSVTGALLITSLSACPVTANVSEVFTALDANGDRRRQVFETDTKQIHCVAEVGISRPGVTLEFLIRQIQRYDFDDGTFKDTNRVLSQAEFTSGGDNGSSGVSSGASKTDFTFSKEAPDGTRDDDGPYPPGRYVCEVRLDGKFEGQAIFNVIFPDCPSAKILPDSRCYGFYENGRQCPAFGASTDRAISCACTTKGWKCP